MTATLGKPVASSVMTRDEILAVATRCESEVPNVYLASAILVAAGHQTLFRGEKLGWEWRKDGKGTWSPMPRPDLSLDAAVTLYKKKPETISTDPRKVCAEALRQWA